MWECSAHQQGRMPSGPSHWRQPLSPPSSACKAVLMISCPLHNMLSRLAARLQLVQEEASKQDRGLCDATWMPYHRALLQCAAE